MKHLKVVFAAFVGISSARSVLTARQEDNKVTPVKICAWFEAKNNERNAASYLPLEIDATCRSDAQKCIDNQLKKSQVLDQVVQDNITLCTFSTRIGHTSTYFLSICDDLDMARETCHSKTTWCVMKYAYSSGDYNEALGEVKLCVAESILNKDGDTVRNLVAAIPVDYNMICKKTETSVRCNSSISSHDLGRAICNEDHYPAHISWEEYDEENKLVEDCRKEFYDTTPASDIIKHTQLGQYCQSQGVECSKCKWYIWTEERTSLPLYFDTLWIIECQAAAQPGTRTESQAKNSTLTTRPADRQPNQLQQSLEKVDDNSKNTTPAPELTPKSARLPHAAVLAN